MTVDWSAHQRWLIVGGQAVNLIELGQGPPLLFVHGLLGSRTNWLEQLPVFAAEHRVLAPDLPGFGHSPMPAQGISLTGYARLLERLLDQLGIETAVVVGHSMGGAIACELALACPARVERLVLVSAVGIGGRMHPATRPAEATVRRLEPMLRHWGARVASEADRLARRRRVRQAALAIYVRHPGRLSPPAAAELMRGAGKPGLHQGLRAIMDCDLRGRLPQIACPTLILWGGRDVQVDVGCAARFNELIPRSRSVVFPDTGHVPMLERPDAFNAALQEFLREQR
jgi:pimeloyl-ACP methyl ester carboxylesterase